VPPSSDARIAKVTLMPIREFAPLCLYLQNPRWGRVKRGWAWITAPRLSSDASEGGARPQIAAMCHRKADFRRFDASK
jgi:hypothetical protein